MLLLALLGALSHESAWKGESDIESNGILDMFYRRILNKTVTSWVLSKGTAFNVNSFLDGVEKILGTPFKSRSITMNAVLGGIWIRGTADGMVLSAYWHPTKNHSVSVYKAHSITSGEVLPEKPQTAPPDCWAVAFGNPGTAMNVMPMYRVIQ